jgi:hypothetical protein
METIKERDQRLQQAALMARNKRMQKALCDVDGHPFRGNQYTDGAAPLSSLYSDAPEDSPEEAKVRAERAEKQAAHRAKKEAYEAKHGKGSYQTINLDEYIDEYEANSDK